MANPKAAASNVLTTDQLDGKSNLKAKRQMMARVHKKYQHIPGTKQYQSEYLRIIVRIFNSKSKKNLFFISYNHHPYHHSNLEP